MQVFVTIVKMQVIKCNYNVEMCVFFWTEYVVRQRNETGAVTLDLFLCYNLIDWLAGGEKLIDYYNLVLYASMETVKYEKWSFHLKIIKSAAETK